MNDYFLLPYFWFPPIPPICDKPPTLYSLLESIVNYGKDDKQKIKDLAKYGRSTIFDFDYPLSNYINKEKFETMILNHFLMRRIGFETFTAFQIQLNVKLNEIMPIYNKMFDSLENWDLFSDGSSEEKVGTNNKEIKNTTNSSNEITNTAETESNNISDRRNSQLPQNQLENLRNGSYVTNYNYDTNTATSNDNSNTKGTSEAQSNTNDDTVYTEKIKRDVSNKLELYKEFQTNIKNIYSMIFKDLDVLFYQLV